MEKVKNFRAETEEDLWQQFASDLAAREELLDYTARLSLANRTVIFNIDVDLGGGFEGGFETTSFTAPVTGHNDLRIHIYPQDWVNEIGKLFGLEDVELGYPELDKEFIIKTNQTETLKSIFTDQTLQETLLKNKNVHI